MLAFLLCLLFFLALSNYLLENRYPMNKKHYLDEVWVDIQGYEGLYQISNYGRIRAYVYRGANKMTMLHISARNGNYLKVGLVKDGKRKYYRIHRLVAINFLPTPSPEETQVEHVDCNKQNNYVKCVFIGGWFFVSYEGSNLRWTTPKGNMCNELTRKRISEALRNPSPERRARMSDGQKRRYKRERETHTGRYLFS